MCAACVCTIAVFSLPWRGMMGNVAAGSEFWLRQFDPVATAGFGAVKRVVGMT